jgi:hypothetical protein
VDEKARSINLNYATICEELRTIYENTISNLQTITRSKLETILSVEIELRRQKEQLQWANIFIEKQYQNTLALLSPNPNNKTTMPLTIDEKKNIKLRFMKLWRSHTMFCNNIGNSHSFFPCAIFGNA